MGHSQPTEIFIYFTLSPSPDNKHGGLVVIWKYNAELNLLTVFLYSAFATYAFMPYVLQKLKKFGYVVKDMHKLSRPLIPSLGGVAIFAGVMVSLALSQLLFRDGSSGKVFIFYFIVIVYALYGLLDDLFHFKRRYDKIAVLLVLSLPIASLLSSTYLDIFGFMIDLDGFYLYLLAPVYIMVVANLVNIHAGFNGLGPGTALLVLIAAGIESYTRYGLLNLPYLMPILGALSVFIIYNWYPAKVFDGNIGAFLMGGALGAFLIVNHLEVFGVICLLPNIITFVLDTWVLGIRKRKDIEFPVPRKDNLIVPAPTMRYKSFKNVLCTWFKLTEKKATILSLSITAICCAVAVFLI